MARGLDIAQDSIGRRFREDVVDAARFRSASSCRGADTGVRLPTRVSCAASLGRCDGGAVLVQSQRKERRSE